MALVITSKTSGDIRFYREWKHMGGHLLALYPGNRGDLTRTVVISDLPGHYFHEYVDRTYLRNITPAQERDRAEAEPMIRFIDTITA